MEKVEQSKMVNWRKQYIINRTDIQCGINVNSEIKNRNMILQDNKFQPMLPLRSCTLWAKILTRVQICCKKKALLCANVCRNVKWQSTVWQMTKFSQKNKRNQENKNEAVTIFYFTAITAQSNITKLKNKSSSFILISAA